MTRLFLLFSVLPCVLHAQATVLLSAFPNSSQLGVPVTLTATVFSPSPTGTVTFLDGVNQVGVKPVSGGTASISTVLLSAGTHQLSAFYFDSATFITGASNVIAQTVRAFPGGSFVSDPFPGIHAAFPQAALGDFNHDNHVDFAIPNSSQVTILFGNGDGTFLSPANYAISTKATFLLSADFNGDGNADLVTDGGVVLLGSDNGAFRFGPPVPLGALTPVAVGDFNGDGRADLIVEGVQTTTGSGPLASVTQTSIYLLPGNGDGSFGAAILYANLGNARIAASGFLVGDWNGDGKPDIVVANVAVYSTPTAGILSNLIGVFNYILLGNGDGTVRSLSAISIGGIGIGAPNSPNLSPVTSLISGDFNGDGRLDLAVGGSAASNGVAITEVLLGNGDGTFQLPFGYAAGAVQASSDFNGDGLADLVVTGASSTAVLYGNGDGTFQSGPAISTSALGILGVADFNGDGKADMLYSTSGTIAVLLGSQAASTPPSAPGPATITASGGTPQIAATGGAFASPLQVTVLDGSGNPVSGVTVTFAAPAVGPGATLSSPTGVTNSSGVTSVTAIANNNVGSYAVTASAGALSTSFSLTNVSGSGSDLALGKPATQSSTLAGAPSAVAESAVDGSTDGAFFDGSVTATNADPNAWWQVDLGASVSASSIVIWNRTDCCGTRLSDYWVFVSDTPFLPTDTPATLQLRAGTFASHQTTAPNPSTTITGAGAQGRYVRVQLTGTGYLSLAEVQVFGTVVTPAATNISTGKLATQSSTLPGAPTAAAGSAVDGNTDGAFYDGSVTATNADPNAWWQVDLGAPSMVNSVVVWNRTDCCATRLSDFWVFVSNTPFLATDTPATLQNRAGTFASHQTTAPNPSTTITVAMQGRYVRVQLSDTDYLSLAEVQVIGVGGAPSLNNLSQGKTATESSTLPGVPTAAASSAVDGNTDGNFYDGSVTATTLDPNPWWEVDLGSTPTVSSVTVWNRMDCCGSRLSDYWVFVSSSPFLDSDTVSTLQNRPGTFAIHQTATPNPSTNIPVGMQGRYVRVQLSSAGYLSLAEVQVFGQ